MSETPRAADPEHLSRLRGAQVGLIDALVYLKGSIGSITYPLGSIPAHHTRKRARIEDRAAPLRQAYAALEAKLRILQGLTDPEKAPLNPETPQPPQGK